jgi:hypothetical protein
MMPLDNGASERGGCGWHRYMPARGKPKCEANAYRRNPKVADQSSRGAVRRFAPEDDITRYWEQRVSNRHNANWAADMVLMQIGGSND